jgi:hypothetical protein
VLLAVLPQRDHVGELHLVHLLIPGPPDAAYQPDPLEVAGLAWIGVDDLLELVEGRLPAATVRYRAVDAPSDGWVARTLTAADLVPYAEGYHRWLLDAVKERVRPS